MNVLRARSKCQNHDLVEAVHCAITRCMRVLYSWVQRSPNYFLFERLMCTKIHSYYSLFSIYISHCWGPYTIELTVMSVEVYLYRTPAFYYPPFSFPYNINLMQFLFCFFTALFIWFKVAFFGYHTLWFQRTVLNNKLNPLTYTIYIYVYIHTLR